jgi:hypothetical protein
MGKTKDRNNYFMIKPNNNEYFISFTLSRNENCNVRDFQLWQKIMKHANTFILNAKHVPH